MTTCEGIVQFANRYTEAFWEVLGDFLLNGFPQNHNLQETIKQFHMTDHGPIPQDSNFDFELMVTWTHCISTSFYLLVASNQGCLNCKPSSILARFFSHTSWDLFNIWLLHPTPWLTVKEYFPFNLYPFTTYFYIQRCSKDHYMWLKLGDIFRIDIKNHDMLQAKKLQESFMVTCYNWLFTLWRA